MWRGEEAWYSSGQFPRSTTGLRLMATRVSSGTQSSFRRLYEEPIVRGQQPDASTEEKLLGQTRAAEVTNIFLRVTIPYIVKRRWRKNKDSHRSMDTVMIYQKIIQVNIEINFTAVRYVNLYSKFKMNPAFENILCRYKLFFFDAWTFGRTAG